MPSPLQLASHSLCPLGGFSIFHFCGSEAPAQEIQWLALLHAETFLPKPSVYATLKGMTVNSLSKATWEWHVDSTELIDH